MTSVYILLLMTVLLSWVTVQLVLKFSGRLGLMQQSNGRSSHQGQKPTGGGVGLVIACAATGLWIGLVWQPAILWIVAVVSGLALVGFLDDRAGLSVRLRLGAQALTMVALVALSFSMSDTIGIKVDVFFATYDLPAIWIAPLIIVGGTYWINLFNFMDGIDGLAASQAAFVCFALLILSIGIAGAQFDGMWFWCASVGCAAVTFLWFNWPPARIFMGDVGAYFFSASIAIFALYGILSNQLQWGAMLILVSLFVVDASVTLARRALSGQNWWGAHKTHAYQYLSRRWGHQKTVAIYMLVNCVLLLPLAALVQLGWLAQWLGLFCAYLPLVGIALWARAGETEHA